MSKAVISAANGTFGAYATGSRTSVYSQAVSKAYQSGAINVGTRGALRGVGRTISMGLPFVSTAFAAYEIYDAFNCD